MIEWGPTEVESKIRSATKKNTFRKSAKNTRCLHFFSRNGPRTSEYTVLWRFSKKRLVSSRMFTNSVDRPTGCKEFTNLGVTNRSNLVLKPSYLMHSTPGKQGLSWHGFRFRLQVTPSPVQPSGQGPHSKPPSKVEVHKTPGGKKGRLDRMTGECMQK